MGGQHGCSGHNHSHSHAPTEFNRAFVIAIVANGLFVICQIVFAVIASSTSLLADAVHNLGDVLGLVMAWVANRLLTRKSTDKTTYGLKKSSILAALANGVMLVFTCGIIATEAMYKLFLPSPVHAVYVMVIAAIGIVVNSLTAALFLKGKDDLNIRAAYLHLVYDALISVGVVLGAVVIYYTNWLWVDPLVGLLIAIIILKGTWEVFKTSFQLILDGVPQEISVAHVREFLLSQAGVEAVHDLHIWALSTKENALSVHLVVPNSVITDEVRFMITEHLRQKFNIHHPTIQLEQDEQFCRESC